MARSFLFSSSIGRKYAMAASAMFIVLFLILHVILNSFSIFSAEIYNNVSTWMGYNWIIQAVMQPLLAFALIFHVVMAFVLTIQNKKARPVQYAYSNQSRNANSTWASRNMIITGMMILAFLVLHSFDFWFPELGVKFEQGYHEADLDRFYCELMHRFSHGWRLVAYCVAFFFLALHLWHGVQSMFQSFGWNYPRYMPGIKTFGKWFAVVVPALFVLIALINYLRAIGVMEPLMSC